MPSSNVPSFAWGSGLQIDKLAHIFLYAMYTFLLGRYLTDKSWKKSQQNGVLIGLPIFYGILMEILQYYLSSSRSFDMLDIIANIIGSLTGLIILKIKF